MVISLERGADLHVAQLMPLPLTVSCFSKIQIGFTFPVLAHLGSPRKWAVKWACVCYIYCLLVYIICFPTYPFFFTFFLLISSLTMFSFENRHAPFPGRLS